MASQPFAGTIANKSTQWLPNIQFYIILQNIIIKGDTPLWILAFPRDDAQYDLLCRGCIAHDSYHPTNRAEAHMKAVSNLYSFLAKEAGKHLEWMIAFNFYDALYNSTQI